ncbi:MAG: trigger factor [Gammaproteobacteria bacterium]|nr:trigger factor [Gammaproteobacteria bacterium]
MQVSVETGEGLERKLTIQVPAETVDKEVDSRLQSLKSRVKIDGFRPGKVPLKVVKQQYGAQVHQEVVGDVMQTSFRDAVIKEELKPAGSPTIEPKTMALGEPLEYVATFEIYPEVELADFSKLEIERESAEVTDADIDTMIDTLRKQRTSYETVERASQNDDQVTISFEGFIDGEAFEGGKADAVPVVIGSGSMIPGFEENLVGKSAGDEFSFEVSFPDDYHAENLKGKAATFETKIVSVAEPKMPELDEEFAKSFGIEDGNMDKLLADIRENMNRELTNKLRASLKNNVMDAMLKANDVLVPKALIDDECENLQKQMSESGNLQGGMTLPKDLFEGEAKRRVSLGLLIGEAVKVSEIKVDADRVKAKIEEIAATYEDPQEVMNHYQKNPQLMSGVEALVMEEMVVDWVVDQAKVTDKATNFQDVMKPAAQA